MAMMMARMQQITVIRKAIVDGDMEMRFGCGSYSVLILMIDSSICDTSRGEKCPGLAYKLDVFMFTIVDGIQGHFDTNFGRFERFIFRMELVTQTGPECSEVMSLGDKSLKVESTIFTSRTFSKFRNNFSST